MKKRFRLNWARGAKLKVERLLEGGIDIDGPMDSYGFTLLHHAVDIGTSANQGTRDESESVTKLLIDKGANVNAEDNCGRTPLMVAVESYNINVVKILLEKGSSIDTHCKYGKSLLHYAVLNPGNEVADLVVKKGASLNETDTSGQNPLEEAINLNNKIIFQFLKDLGATYETSRNSDVTPLQRVSFWGKNDEVARLILRGSNLESKDKAGVNALIVATRSGKFDTVKMLLDSGADVSAQDNDGNSALHWASKLCLGDIVRLLLQYGANPLWCNKAQETPFDKAVEGMTGDSKIPMGSVYSTSPVISHLLDYGFCRHLDSGCFIPSNGHRSERDAIDFATPFTKVIIANDLRRSLAGLPHSNSMYPFTLEHGISFSSAAFKKQHKNWDTLKRKNNPQFCTDCKREIAIMKTISLTNKLTLFDVLTKPVDKVIPYISEETVEHLLVSDDCADDLPIYWGMVQSRLEVLFQRKILINCAHNFFTSISPMLPHECIEIILKNLSIEDYKLLRGIVYLFDLKDLI